MSTQDTCPTDMGVFDYVLGWVLIIGTLISFLPQHLKIFELRSHAGLSYTSFSLGNVISFTTVVNYCAISIKSTFFCCGPDVSFLNCSGSLLAFTQLIFNYICQHIIIVLYMIYYDHEYAKTQVEEKSLYYETGGQESINKEEFIEGTHYQQVRFYCWLQLAFQMIVISLLFFFIFYYGLDSNILYIFGVIMMIITSIIACIQFIPQIIETYQHKDWGSLSFLMILLQAFGALLVGVNLAPHGSWDLWTPYIVLSFMQFVLLVEGSYYSCRKRWGSRKTGEEPLIDVINEGE